MAGKKIGPKFIKIDWDKFDKLAHIQCTRDEIAFAMGVSHDTLERACMREKGLDYASYFAQRCQGGRISLRHKMYQRAMAGRDAVLIFMSKQPNWLGFRDTPEMKPEDARPITLNYKLED